MFSKNKRKKNNSKKILLTLLIGLSLLIASFWTYQEYFAETPPIEEVDYPEEFPDIYAGTGSGEVYHIEGGSQPEFVGDFDLEMHNLRFSEGTAWLAAGTEGGKSNIIRVRDGETREYDLEGFTHDVTATEEYVFIADHGQHAQEDEDNVHTHEHGGEEHTHGNGDADHVHVGDSLRVLTHEGVEVAEIDLSSAYKVQLTERGVFAMGAAGDIILVDEEELTVEEEFNVGDWVGDIHYQAERDELLVTVREDEKDETSNENITQPTVRNGKFKRYDMNGELLSEVKLGLSAMPHDVRPYDRTTSITVGMLEGKIYTIDLLDEEFESFELERETSLEDHHHTPDLEIVGDYAYVADSEHDLLYQIDLTENTVVNDIEIPDLNGLTLAPEEPVEWP